jgi:inositol oxygenase
METPVKEKEQFRNYEQGDITAAVKEHYRKMRSRQTYDYVQRMKAKYLTFERPMDLWEMMERLNALVDVSDPDLNLPNIIHLLQSAEGLRADGRPDWMQLVGLIHDLGKAMYLFGSDEDGTSQAEQWGLVGDVFVVGCKLPDSCVYPEFNALNPDMQDPRYNTELGVYEAGCGLDNLHLAWGHDEYLYQVLKNHPENSIPEAGMAMIRYH